MIDNPADMLEAAAEELEAHGWIRGAGINSSGQRCILNALSTITPSSQFGVYTAAREKLAAVVGTSAIVVWNDKICQSQQEAVDALLLAAKHWRMENEW